MDSRNIEREINQRLSHSQRMTARARKYHEPGSDMYNRLIRFSMFHRNKVNLLRAQLDQLNGPDR